MDKKIRTVKGVDYKLVSSSEEEHSGSMSRAHVFRPVADIEKEEKKKEKEKNNTEEKTKEKINTVGKKKVFDYSKKDDLNIKVKTQEEE